MINIYAPGTDNWANNGLAILLPTDCKISETAGGSYDLELTHPISDDLRWKTIAEGCVIKAPVPASETPAINLVKAGIPAVPEIPAIPGNPGTPAIPAVEPIPGRIIWKVHITTTGSGGRSRIYERAHAGSKALAYLREGNEYEYLGAYNGNWHRAVNSAGISGYMYTPNSVYVRTEAATGGRAAVPAIPPTPGVPGVPGIPAVPGYSTVVGPRQIRTQLFRVYHVEMNTENNTVKAWARHISYDFMGNICGNLKLANVPMPIALERLKASMITAETRDLVTNMPETISGEWQYENGIKVLLDPENGFVAKSRCKIIRDNNDIFLLSNVAYDRRVKVEYGKNLNGVTWTKRNDEIITRIVPIGRNADNTNLLLPEIYVDSQYINSYPVIHTQKLDVPDAKISATMTAAQAYAVMRKAANAEFTKGCDLVSFDLSVDFIQLGDTEEYKQYHDLQQVFLYDTISITHSPTDFSARAQVKAYEWDAILNRYTKVTMGDVFEAGGSTIAGYQLPNSGISGTKLVPGGVGSDQLRNLSVLSAHIGLAEVKTANIGLAVIEKGHMKEATINDLKADSIEAVRAHVQQLIADELTADELYANLATIAIAQLTTANITNAIIDWATIENLKAAMITAFRARIEYLITENLVTDELYTALATIASAEIGTADINWANIKDLVTGRTVFQEGVGGKLYIADLAVTEANFAALTVGELVVKGSDGRFYALTVDVDGNLTTTLKQVNNEDIADLTINAGEKVIEGSVTAATLNAQDIFADNAIIKQLMAANLDVDILFAREGTVEKLKTMDLVATNDSIKFTVDDLNGKVAALLSNVGGLTGNKVETDQYVQVGLLYIDENSVPRFGLGIGENLTRITDINGNVVLERSGLAQTITSDRQSFWQNGVEVAYFYNKKLYVNDIEAISTITIGNWIMDTSYGFALRWAGED